MSLIKTSGKNAKKQRAKIALRVKNDLDSGKKLGDLTNGEMHTFDKAKSKMLGNRGDKEAGKKAKSFANWAKNTRQEPGSTKVGTTGDKGEGLKYNKNSNAADDSKGKGLKERLSDHKEKKIAKKESVRKGGSGLGMGTPTPLKNPRKPRAKANPGTTSVKKGLSSGTKASIALGLGGAGLYAASKMIKDDD